MVIDRLPGLRGWCGGDGVDHRTVADRLYSMAQTLDVPLVVLARLNLGTSPRQSHLTSDDVQDIDSMERFRRFFLISQVASVASLSSGHPTITIHIEDPVCKTDSIVLTSGSFESAQVARSALAVDGRPTPLTATPIREQT